MHHRAFMIGAAALAGTRAFPQPAIGGKSRAATQDVNARHKAGMREARNFSVPDGFKWGQLQDPHVVCSRAFRGRSAG